MMPPPPQMVPLWRLWLHAASERARAASQRTARARWGGDRATRSVDGSGDGSGVGSVDGSGIGRVVGSAAESDGGSGVVSRVSSARRSADNQSRLPAFMLSDHRGFVIRPPGVCFQPAENKPALVCYRPIAGFVMRRRGLL